MRGAGGHVHGKLFCAVPHAPLLPPALAQCEPRLLPRPLTCARAGPLSHHWLYHHAGFGCVQCSGCAGAPFRRCRTSAPSSLCSATRAWPLCCSDGDRLLCCTRASRPLACRGASGSLCGLQAVCSVPGHGGACPCCPPHAPSPLHTMAAFVHCGNSGARLLKRARGACFPCCPPCSLCRAGYPCTLCNSSSAPCPNYCT